MISSVRSQVQQLDSNLALTNVQTIGELLSQGLWARAWAPPCSPVFGGLALVPRDYRGLWSLVVFGESANPRNWNSDGNGSAARPRAPTRGRQGMRLAVRLASRLLVAFAAMRPSKAYSSASALTTR